MRGRGLRSIRLIAISDFEAKLQGGCAESASAFDVGPALFLFGDYFGDSCGDGFGARDEVGQGEFAGFHGVLAGLEVDMFLLQGLDVGDDGGGGLEDGDSRAEGDELDLVGVGAEGGEEVAHVA
jgi:hypothetical protein